MYVIWMWLMASAEALTTAGFDCGIKKHEKLNIKTFSLIDINPCNITKPIIESRQFVGQIVQTKVYEHRTVFQCKVKIFRIIRGCGWLFNDLKTVNNGMAEFMLDISHEQCMKMHSAKSFAYDSLHILSDLRVNETNFRSMNLAGNSVDRRCHTGSYSDRFGTWNDVVVEANFFITLSTYTAKVDIPNDRILLRSGVGCKYSDTQCLDIESGLNFWETLDKIDCLQNKLEVLYEDKIDAVTETRNDISKIHYFVRYNKFVGAFKFSGLIEICDRKFIKTEFSNLFIVENKEHFLRVKVGYFPNLVDYVNSKIVYAEQENENQMRELYMDIINQKCETDIKAVKDILTLAYLSPDLFAYNLMGPGYMAHVAGELIHMVKCLAVEVTVLENATTCYKQIPITYEDKDYFLSQKTKIIIRHGTETHCNRILHTGFKINSEWFTFTPKLERIEEPAKLSPITKYSWSPRELTEIATGGIYSEDELNDYMRQINFPIERENILDNTASTFSRLGESDSENQNYLPFTANYWESIMRSYWQEFEEFGSISAGILMIVLVIWIISQAIQTIIRGFALHKVIGFSTGLLAACFGSLTQYVLTTKLDGKTQKRDDKFKTIEMATLERPKKRRRIPKKSNEPLTPHLPKIPIPPTPPPRTPPSKTYAEIHEIPILPKAGTF